MILDIQVYTGEGLTKDAEEPKPLIDGVLWEGDVMMLLGSEKAGKSIMAMQMLFSLTSGETFLDKYPVSAPMPVLYFQTEGKRFETASRIIRMAHALEYNKELFIHFYKKCFPIDVQEYMDCLKIKIMGLTVKPKVLVLDSLYTTMKGDLIDNTDVRIFFEALSSLCDQFQLTVIIIHHESKELFGENFQVIERGDKGSYGSVFLRAFMEHILYLKKHRDKSRTLTCSTQRTGKVLESEDLILVHDDPLYFEIKGDCAPFIQVCKHRISKSACTKKEIIESTGLSEGSVKKAIRELLKNKSIGFQNSPNDVKERLYYADTHV